MAADLETLRLHFPNAPTINAPMSPDVVQIVEQLLAKLPQWLRQDLLSNDPSIRLRAEETLAAMIAAALTETAPAVAG